MATNEPLEIRRATVSDLFFNFSHPSYELACENEETVEQRETALMEDATAFMEVYGDMVRHYVPELNIDAEWLHSDFFRRL